MKKTSSALLLVCAIGFSMGGCSGVSSNSPSPIDSSWDTVRAKNTLIVGVEENSEPLFLYDRGGNPTGLTVESAREVAQKLGVAVGFRTLSPSKAQQALDNDEIDCFWSSYSKPIQQNELSNLTPGYMKNNRAVFTLADGLLNNLANLKGQRVGVEEGFDDQQAVEASTTLKSCLAQLGMYQDYIQAKSSPDSKRISAVIMDEVLTEYCLKQAPRQYRILRQIGSDPTETLETGGYSIAFRETDESPTVRVQEALNELPENGTTSRLSKQWFGADLSIASSTL